MLWFGLGGHLVTAAVAASSRYTSGAAIGYYVMAAYLLSAAIRPAAAYLRTCASGSARSRRRACIRARTWWSCARRLPGWPAPPGACKRSWPAVQRELADDLRRTEVKLADGTRTPRAGC